jgi:hypothetical protein
VACVLCAVGTYAATSGLTVCAPCNAGYFAPVAGSTSCVACPDGTGSFPGGSVCVSCVA